MIRNPRSSPQSGRSHVQLVLALAGVSGLLFFLFSRTSTSRAAPHDGAQAATPAPPSESAAADDAAGGPELAPALALTDVEAPAESPDLAAEAAAVPAGALAAAGSTEPVPTSELAGPKLKHFRGKGSSNQDLRVSQHEKGRAKRKEREAAQAQAAASGAAEPAKAKDGTKRARWRERAQVPPSERKPKPTDE